MSGPPDAARSVVLVVPEGIDDPARPSGGNVYDERLRDGLGRLGWQVDLVEVAGAWPEPRPEDVDRLLAHLDARPDGTPTLVDGLVGSAAATRLIGATGRLRLVPLVHQPLDRDSEGALLRASAATLATSHWSRGWLLVRYGLPEGLVGVAAPGVDPADPSPGSLGGQRLLSVAAVCRAKGHDVLVDALTRIRHLDWHCTLLGRLDLDTAFVDDLRERCQRGGLTDRVVFAGPRGRDEVDKAYAEADLVVLASHAETYGMVLTEALAHGVPVVATPVGGVPEAVGRTETGAVPGHLVPPGDPDALAFALRRWLVDPVRRHRLRRAAARRRLSLTTWDQTASDVAQVLDEVAR